MLTTEQVTEAFTTQIMSDYWTPAIVSLEVTGESEGFTEVRIDWYRNEGNEASHEVRTYKFRWDEWDERVHTYFH